MDRAALVRAIGPQFIKHLALLKRQTVLIGPLAGQRMRGILPGRSAATERLPRAAAKLMIRSTSLCGRKERR
jgi:hypothetical protein